MKTQVKQRKMGITALCASLLHYKMFWSHTNLLIELEWKGFPGKRDLNRLQVSLLFLIISKIDYIKNSNDCLCLYTTQ